VRAAAGGGAGRRGRRAVRTVGGARAFLHGTGRGKSGGSHGIGDGGEVPSIEGMERNF
jgi:hypothetical protein